MFEGYDQIEEQAVIKVIGVGGGGGNALEYMVKSGIEGVEFINANTDAQVLKISGAHHRIQLGSELTKGLGAGANPDIGRDAALEDKEQILQHLKNTDMVFITAGMGGGTGTGAAPVIAEMAKELGVLTVAVVTKPFSFEGRKRQMAAEKGISELAQHVDSLITIPNDKILTVLGKQAKLTDSFAKANDVLYNAVQGISELITHPGFMNVDFADVKTVMSEMGLAMMGSAVAKGTDRAVEATRAALSSPFLEDIDMTGAKGILINITATKDIEIGELQEVGAIIDEYASEEAEIILGTALDGEMGDELRVTIVATGIENPRNGHVANRKELKNIDEERAKQRAARAMTLTNTVSEAEIEQIKKAEEEGTLGQGRVGRSNFKGAAALATKEDRWDELDVPAFMRKQTD